MDEPSGAARWSWRAWVSGRRRDLDALEDAGTAIAILVVVLRLGVVAQAAPSAWLGVRLSPRPDLYATCWVAAAAMSVLISVVVGVRRRPPGGRLIAIDVVLTSLLLVVATAALQPEDRMGSWVAFPPGYAVAVLLTASAAPRRRGWIAALTLVFAADIVYVWPLLFTSDLPTVLSELVTVVVVAVAARLSVGAVLRTAAAADEARARAADLARQDEVRRAREAFHNGVAMMRHLSDPSPMDQVPREALRRQAHQEANRMRAYLRGHPEPVGPADEGGRSLIATLARAAAPFEELGVELVTDLADGVVLEQADSSSVEAATASVLLNVRQHAEAERVVIHAEAMERRWIVTVHDDGQGFLVRPETFGVGLRDVVIEAMRRRGGRAQVESDPGLGTVVTLEGPIR